MKSVSLSTEILQDKGYFFTTQSQLLTTLYKKPLQNIVGKGENAGNQPLLLFLESLGFNQIVRQSVFFDSITV